MDQAGNGETDKMPGGEGPLRILLTNDDGIHAPGLLTLYEALRDEHIPFVVAPEHEMSAVGHAITLDWPLRVREVHRDQSLYGYAVSGTPADCVKIAVQELLPQRPHMVLSGINLGANVGVNVLYSGTVSAATEGAFLGIPSVAISLAARRRPDFKVAARFAARLIALVSSVGLGPGTALNVNIPALSEREIRGVRITRQATGPFLERYERRSDPRGNVYYWLTGETFVKEADSDTDLAALEADMISITPIHYDLTAQAEVQRLRALGRSLWPFS